MCLVFLTESAVERHSCYLAEMAEDLQLFLVSMLAWFSGVSGFRHYSLVNCTALRWVLNFRRDIQHRCITSIVEVRYAWTWSSVVAIDRYAVCSHFHSNPVTFFTTGFINFSKAVLMSSWIGICPVDSLYNWTDNLQFSILVITATGLAHADVGFFTKFPKCLACSLGCGVGWNRIQLEES